tara:strand:+ start:797 stop:2962 length:2166 start_codon:yes stop_codon:yes gene_type:complete
MASPSWTSNNAGGPSWAISKDPDIPEDANLVKVFNDGSYVVERNGTQTFVDPDSAYVTSDPKKIAEIIASNEGGTRAGDISRGEIAQNLVGELPTRIFSAMQGIPFVREYIPNIAGTGASMVSQMGDSQGASVGDMTGLIEQATARREQEAPKTVLASRLATGGGVAIPFAPAITARTTLGKIAQATGLGGFIGGTEGFVSGLKDGLPEAIEQAETGAKFGAGFGGAGTAVAGPAGFLYGKYLEGPVQRTIESIGFKKDAAKVVQDALTADAADAVESAQTAGPYGSVSVLGPNVTALLDYVANTSGSGQKIIRDNLNSTALAASKDLKTSLDTILGNTTAGIKTQKKQIMTDTAESRRKLYGEAYDFKINADQHGNVTQLLSRVPDADLSGAKQLLQLAGEEFDLENPTVATVDYITRRLFDEAQSLKISGNMAASMAKKNLAFQLRSALDEVNPTYKAARAAGKDAIDQKLAADLGNDILNPRVTREDVAIALDSIDEVGIAQLKQALRNRIDALAANAKVNPSGTNDVEVVEALAQLKALNTRAVAEKLRMVLGDETADLLGQQISDTSSAFVQRAAVALNSKTAIRTRIDERVKELVGESLGETISRQGLLPTTSGVVAQSLIGGPKQGERLREIGQEIAPVLTQRMSPEDLLLQAQRMSSLAPQIEQAQEAKNLFQERLRSGGMGLGTATGGQLGQSDFTIEDLMRDMGLSNFSYR